MAVLRSIPNEFFTMIHGNYSLTSLILPTDCPTDSLAFGSLQHIAPQKVKNTGVIGGQNAQK